MLDIGWSEILLIAVVAIVVIGPKDLPGALRAMGAGVARMRRMASEFQGQFNEALREANLEDVKRDLDSLRGATSAMRGAFNPVALVRNELGGVMGGAMTGQSAVPAVQAEPMSTTVAPMPITASTPTPAGEGIAVERPDEPIPSAFAPLAVFKRA